MTKGKHFTIDLVIYPFTVLVSIGQTDEEFNKTLKKYKPDIDDKEFLYEDDKSNGGYTCIYESNKGLIRMLDHINTNLDFAYLQHEIFHFVMCAFDKIGLTWTHESDEAYAYTLQYLTKKIYDKLS